MLDIAKWTPEFQRLLDEEGLHDRRQFLQPLDEFDEVPLYTRVSRIAFLDGLTAEERSIVLVAFGLEYLNEIIRIAGEEIDRQSRRNFFIMMTILNWNGFDHGEPILPCSWTSTRATEELQNMSLAAGTSTEAQKVSSWVRALGLSDEFSILDYSTIPAERALMRVHVGHRQLPESEMPTILQCVGEH